MGKTKIQWTERTWNPVVGCSPVSSGCKNCWAAQMAHRSLTPAHAGLTTSSHWSGKVRCLPERLNEPLTWRKPQMCAVALMGDLFHDSVPDAFIGQVFGVMARARKITFQVLTKRSERMLKWFGNVGNSLGWWTHNGTEPARAYQGTGEIVGYDKWPLPNVWLGVSVEDDGGLKRVENLLRCPAAVRWVSLEPLLGSVNIAPYLKREFYAGEKKNPPKGTIGGKPYRVARLSKALDWVVVGGETGPGARPVNPKWVNSIQKQCQEAGTPFFFKHWGEWASIENIPERFQTFRAGTYTDRNDLVKCERRGIDMDGKTATERGYLSADFTTMYRIGKKAVGRLLNGKIWEQYPIGG